MEHSSTGGTFCEVAKLSVIGSVFVGIGALLNGYVPAFHAPVSWVDTALKHTGQKISRLPVAGTIFHNNPLASNPTVRQFLAVNIVESVMIGGVILTGGALMKQAGIKPRMVDQWLTSNHGEHGRS